MGNSESSSQFPPAPNDHDAKKFTEGRRGESTESSSAGKALKVAAVAAMAGGALLALLVGGAFLAYSLYSSSSWNSNSGSSDEQRAVTKTERVKHERFRTSYDLALAAYSLASSSSSNSGSSDEQRAVTEMQKLKLERFRPAYCYESAQSGNSDEHSFSRMIKILSYNVWLREDVFVHERMKAIGKIIQQYSPDVIFFQEVAPNIYDIFQSSYWWKVYKCSVLPEQAKNRHFFSMLLSKLPVKLYWSKIFENSKRRELCVAVIEAGANKKLTVAPSHLKCPIEADANKKLMNKAKRVAQAKEALRLLDIADNVVFGGDMNWDENHEMPDADGPFPLLDGWYDPWSILVPRENGWTYDVKSNGMLRGIRPIQKRLDRFSCKLRDFKPDSIKMVGMEAIPGIWWYKEGEMLPVFPSDHYGLLLTICPV